MVVVVFNLKSPKAASQAAGKDLQQVHVDYASELAKPFIAEIVNKQHVALEADQVTVAQDV